MVSLWLVALALLASTTLAADASGSSDSSSSSDTSATASNATASDLIGWFDCSAITFEDQRENADSLIDIGDTFSPSSVSAYAEKAECAQYQAPLCHAGVCEDAQGRTIDVFVKRVLARSDPEMRPNMWFLQGGPGAASPTMEYAMRALYIQLDGLVNVYTMDHRGTGRSTPLNCVAAQATTSGSPLGADIDVSEVAACAQELQTKYGDLAAFSITSAASDLSRFITTFQTGSKTFVYGVSYGSALVERLMHLGTKEVVGYILDGVSTTSGADTKDGMYMSNWDVNFGEVGDHFLELLKGHAPTAAATFSGKSIANVLTDALTKVEKDPKHKCANEFGAFLTASGAAPTALKPSIAVRMLLGRLLMSATTRVFIPVLIHRLERCNLNDQVVLAYFGKMMRKQLAVASEEDALMSTLEYYLIVFSEMWETPTPDMATMTARFTNAKISTGPIADLLPLYCAFTKDSSSACSAVVNATTMNSGPALAYQKDKYWNKAATIPTGASVLILSGKLDPQTPHKYAERLLAALDGAQKELVTFQYTAHGALLNAVYPKSGYYSTEPGFCAVELLASYITANGDVSKIDTSCVALVDLYMDDMDAYAAYSPLFGVDHDLYDGELDGHFTRKFLAPLVIAACVVAVLAVAVGTLVYKRRKARKAGDVVQTQSPTNDAPFVEAPSSAVQY